MSDWRELVVAEKFAEAESMMLTEAATPDGYGGETVMKAEFYEAWGDSLGDDPSAKTKYWHAHSFWGLCFMVDKRRRRNGADAGC
jgi:hypothetical protein